MIKLLISLSIFILLVSCNNRTTDSNTTNTTESIPEETVITPPGKYIAGIIDLVIKFEDRDADNRAGLLLIDFGSDKLRYTVYNDYFDADRKDTVFFKIKIIDGIPIASDIQEVVEIDKMMSDAEKSNLLPQMNMNYHSFGFGHSEDDSAHNKIHRIKSIEDDSEPSSRSAKSERIYFEANLESINGPVKKFAINRFDGIDLVVGDTTKWYFQVLGTLSSDGTQVVTLSRQHTHD